ncbi:hypothetical protein U91I_03002 [alpha proteobacterium U9-1i]|nr:hypothetical protein U91I_03002 [alpha proteobacterium U9-1i]
MSDDALVEALKRVETKGDLVAFIQMLAARSGAFANADLPNYLEAMSAWLADSDGYYSSSGQPIPSVPNWRNIGELLLAASMYE